MIKELIKQINNSRRRRARIALKEAEKKSGETLSDRLKNGGTM